MPPHKCCKGLENLKEKYYINLNYWLKDEEVLEANVSSLAA